MPQICGSMGKIFTFRGKWLQNSAPSVFTSVAIAHGSSGRALGYRVVFLRQIFFQSMREVPQILIFLLGNGSQMFWVISAIRWTNKPASRASWRFKRLWYRSKPDCYFQSATYTKILQLSFHGELQWLQRGMYNVPLIPYRNSSIIWSYNRFCIPW